MLHTHPVGLWYGHIHQVGLGYNPLHPLFVIMQLGVTRHLRGPLGYCQDHGLFHLGPVLVECLASEGLSPEGHSELLQGLQVSLAQVCLF